MSSSDSRVVYSDWDGSSWKPWDGEDGRVVDIVFGYGVGFLYIGAMACVGVVAGASWLARRVLGRG